MTISIEIKNVYGKETIYPACENSRLFAELLNQKTLTRKDIKIIESLGFDINVITPKLEEL